MKVAVIGKGSFGRKRIEAIKQTDAKLVDYDQADAVIVCVPPKFHKDVVIRALKAGKHVLCEKPLATNTGDARKMASTAKNYGKFLKVGSNHRFFGNVMKAKSRDIGKIVEFNGRIGHNGKRIKDTWYHDTDISGGGTLMDNGWHLIDLARWFMGDFTESKGLLSGGSPELSALICLKGEGKMAVIGSSWRHLGSYMYIDLQGTKGKLKIRDDSLRNSLVLELEYFFKCIKDNVQPSPSGEDGVAILKIIENIYGLNS